MPRFRIAKQVGPNSYRAISGYSEGYLDNTGLTLLEHYNTPERVDKLLDLGNIHCLGKNLDWPEGTTFAEKQKDKNGTMAFGRDFEVANMEAETLTFNKLDSQTSLYEYVYIFTNANQWAYFKGGMSKQGLQDLRDSVSRLLEAPPPEYITPRRQDVTEVFAYKYRKDQTGAQISESNYRINTYLIGKGYEKSGEVSVSAPMSECGEEYESMLSYCRHRGIPRIVVENLEALDGDTSTVVGILENLCKQGFTVEVIETGAVYDKSCLAAQGQSIEEFQGCMQCQM